MDLTKLRKGSGGVQFYEMAWLAKRIGEETTAGLNNPLSTAGPKRVYSFGARTLTMNEITVEVRIMRLKRMCTYEFVECERL